MEVVFCPKCGSTRIEYICDSTVGYIPQYICSNCKVIFCAFDEKRLSEIYDKFNEQFTRLVMRHGI